MTRFVRAILAYPVLLVLLPAAMISMPVDEAAIDDAPETLREQSSVMVHLRLSDGATIRGRVRGWSARSIEIDHGRFAWREMPAREVWRVGRQILDRSRAEDWLRLGQILSLVAIDQPEAQRFAERAFHRAGQLDPNVAAKIDAIRADVEVESLRRREQRAAEEAARLETTPPEARRWPAAPWPELTAIEQRDARSVMRNDADRILGEIGRSIEAIETSQVLLYTDLERYEAIQIAKQLDQVAHRFAVTMRRDPLRSLFWGKAVVMIFSEREVYERVQAKAFGYLARPADLAIMLPVGPKVFLLGHREGDRRRSELELLRHFVFGLMHRHESPRRLPAWANEGLAEWLTHEVVGEGSWLMKERRRMAYDLIRGDQPLPPVFTIGYGDERWDAAQPIVAPLGALLVEYLVTQQPNGFPLWVQAVKRGESWDAALKPYFGLTPTQLGQRYLRHYRVRD